MTSGGIKPQTGQLAGTAPLRVFVSSVMGRENLVEERSVACDAIKSVPITVPWEFSTSPAESRPVAKAYEAAVAASDILVVIVSRTHSSAVQLELDEAARRGIPILAFVRRVEGAEPLERRPVIDWLRTRTKYREFDTTVELGSAVAAAVALELIQGYRQYRLTAKDVARLAASFPAMEHPIVKTLHEEDLPRCERILNELEQWYPDIATWIPKALATHDVRAVEIDGEIAGLTVTTDKTARVRKISTLYVRPDFQGAAVGPYLIHNEVRLAARDGVEKAYVTFADELHPTLEPLLRRYGFVAEGVSAGRYRAGRGEWVMSKRFVDRTLKLGELREFVEQYLVREQGGEVVARDGDNGLRVLLPRTEVLGVRRSAEHRIILSESSSPEEEYAFWTEELAELDDWTFVSRYGRRADPGVSSSPTNWIDGADLETRFFPLEIERPGQDDLLCTIEPQYADAMIPVVAQFHLWDPARLQIRPDNAFYRAPDNHRSLRRGSLILFYVSAPESKLRGVGRIEEAFVGTPEECLARYSSRGIYRFRELEFIATRHQGRVLALVFDWYRELSPQITLQQIRMRLERDVPPGALKIGHDRVVDALLTVEGHP